MFFIGEGEIPPRFFLTKKWGHIPFLIPYSSLSQARRGGEGAKRSEDEIQIDYRYDPGRSTSKM
jgi:hypothetical protein